MDATTNPATKRCTKCGEVKPLEAFSLDVRARDGRRFRCRACTRAEDAARYAADRDSARAKRRARDTAYRAANLDKVRAKDRVRKAARYAVNPGKERARQTAYTERVAPAYAASKLGTNVKDLTPEMLALYREQLLNKRALRDLNQLLKGLDHDERTEPEPDGRGDLAGLDDVDHG